MSNFRNIINRDKVELIGIANTSKNNTNPIYAVYKDREGFLHTMDVERFNAIYQPISDIEADSQLSGMDIIA